MFRKILVVCIGNICRSPMAVALMRKKMFGSNIVVESAGLSALKEQPIEPLARAVLEEHGCEFLEHRSRQFNAEMAADFDLILVMEKHHLDVVFKVVPEARGKVFLFGKWQADREISDPYKQGRPAFLHTYALIDEAADAWVLRFVH